MTVADDLLEGLVASGMKLRGADGTQGPKGEQGDTGPKGDKGNKGDTGPNGKNGTDGKDGEDGVKGDTGPVGPDEKVKIDREDPKAGFLIDKLEAGRGISLRKARTGSALVIDAEPTFIGGGGAGPQGPPGPPGPGGSGAVDSVNGETGVVVLEAAEVPFIPAGTIAATNVQAAIEEVAAEAGTGGGLPPQWTDGGNGDVTATVDDPAKTPITVQALAGQTAPLSQILDENGGVLETLSQESGAIGATKSWGLPNAKMEVLLDSQPGVFFEVVQRLFVDSVTGGYVWTIDGFVDAVDPANSFGKAVIGVFVGQTAPALTIKDIFGNDIFAKILASGAYLTRAHAAPADGDLVAGDMATWFDQTDGAAAMKIKAKTADGTVVTATVPLT